MGAKEISSVTYIIKQFARAKRSHHPQPKTAVADQGIASAPTSCVEQRTRLNFTLFVVSDAASPSVCVLTTGSLCSFHGF